MTQNNSSDWTVGLTRRLFRYVPKDGEDDDYTIRTPLDPLCKIQIVHLPSDRNTNPSSPSIAWRLGTYNTVFVKQYTCDTEALPLEFVERLMADRDQADSIRGTVEITTSSLNFRTCHAITQLIPEFRSTDVPRRDEFRVKFYFANGAISGDVFDIYRQGCWHFGVTNQHLIADACDMGVPQLTRSLRLPRHLYHIAVRAFDFVTKRTLIETKFGTEYHSSTTATVQGGLIAVIKSALVTINVTKENCEKILDSLSSADRSLVKIAPSDHWFVGPVETRVFRDDDLFMSQAIDCPLKLVWTNSAFLRWPYWHATISDIVIALYHLPAYVLLEIIDQIPWADRQSHKQKIELIMSLQRSIRSLRQIEDNE